MPRPLPLTPSCLAALLLLQACQAPDVSPEIAAFAAAEKEVHAPLQEAFAADLAAARAARIEGRIAQGEAVYALGDQCQDLTSVAGIGQPCHVEEVFTPDETMARLQLAQELLARLEAYIDAVALLVSSTAPAEIAASVPTLTADIETLTNAANDPGLIRAGATLNRFSSALSIGAGMATEAARAATLRRVVREGDPAVEDAVQALLAVMQKQGMTQIQPLYDEVEAADEALDDPQVLGNPARYRAAIARFEAATEALTRESQQSLAGQLVAVRTTHAALARRLASGASLDDILQFTKELAKLRAAIDAAKG